MKNNIARAPHSPQEYFQQGVSLMQGGDTLRALDAYGAAIALESSFWPAYLERARVRLLGQDFHAAIKDLEVVVALAPNEVGAFLDLGRAWQGVRSAERARACFAQAIKINPKFSEAYYNLGVLDYNDGNIDAAIENYTRAIELNPNFVIAYSNLGVSLQAREEADKALATLEKGIAIAPHDPSAHWNKALLLLRNGRYAEGWKQYEWRWSAGKAGDYRRFPGRPLWLGGTKIAGKTILLHAEQGLGDSIQFLRYVTLAAAAGARVLVEVPQTLVSLTRRIKGVAEVIPTGGKLPDFDLHSPLMSLPLAFGTTLESVPCAIPYMNSDLDRVSKWRTRLGEGARRSSKRGARVRPRVGLVWRGNPMHDGDAERSMSFDILREGLAPGVDYVCLQKPIPDADLSLVQSVEGVINLSSDQESFDDACAIIELCDVVISVDTGVAHLAGAMGKPVWIMLPRRAEWRWMKDRPDSPWYPTARLFRQTRQGDWSDVVTAIRSELISLYPLGQHHRGP